MPVASRICFVCWVAHPPLRNEHGPVLIYQLQIYAGTWAFCALGGKSGHSWEPIEPLSVEEVRMYERWRRDHPGEG